SRARSTCSRTAPRPWSFPASSTTPTPPTRPTGATRKRGCASSALPTRSTPGRASAERPLRSAGARSLAGQPVEETVLDRLEQRAGRVRGHAVEVEPGEPAQLLGIVHHPARDPQPGRARGRDELVRQQALLGEHEVAAGGARPGHDLIGSPAVEEVAARDLGRLGAAALEG